MDLVVDYAVLFFVMNVCREKEEASPRASSRIAFVPALALPGSKDGRLAGLGSAKSFFAETVH